LGLRPTPDRVRETLFNWLGQTLDGQECLDLFAGSGALGLEAASRGASRVVLVETAAPVLAALQRNAEMLGANSSGALEIVRSDALQFAAHCLGTGRLFDVVFVDPPYRQGWWPRVQAHLDGLTRDGARVYVEAEVAVEDWPGWTLVRQGRAGQVFHHLFEKDSSHAE
jgi:16S rRNA (guanine966-N2)-methyltransferase